LASLGPMIGTTFALGKLSLLEVSFPNLNHMVPKEIVFLILVYCFSGAVLLVHIFKGSISTMVQRMRPDHVWYPWLWRTRPKSGSASADPTTIRSFLSWVQQRSSTESSLQFWYSVSSEWLRLQKGGVWFFRNTPSHASLSDVLKRVFPEHAWNDELFQAGTKDSPVLLAPVIIQRLAQRLQIDELSMWYSVDPKRANMTTEGMPILRIP
jgi:hypothetical protein